MRTTIRWFGLFTTFKCVAVGIALGVLVEPVTNVAFIFAMYALNVVLLGIFVPHGDLHAAYSELFTAATEAAQIGATMMAVLGSFEGPLVEATLLILTALGFLPCLVGTIFETWNTLYVLLTDTLWRYLSPVTDPLQAQLIDPAKAKMEEIKGKAIELGIGILHSVKGMLGFPPDEEDEQAKANMAKYILEENMNMDRVHGFVPGEAIVAAGGHQQRACPKQTWLNKLREIFAAIDEDGDGSLQRIEVKHAVKRGIIRSTLVRNDVLMSKGMFQKFFDAMDTDHDGEISFEEFVHAVLNSGAFMDGVEAQELLEHIKTTNLGPHNANILRKPVLTASLVHATNTLVHTVQPVQNVALSTTANSSPHAAIGPARKLQLGSSMFTLSPVSPSVQGSSPHAPPATSQDANQRGSPSIMFLPQKQIASQLHSYYESSIAAAAPPSPPSLPHSASSPQPPRPPSVPFPFQLPALVQSRLSPVPPSAPQPPGHNPPSPPGYTPTVAVQRFSTNLRRNFAFPPPQRPQLFLPIQQPQQVMESWPICMVLMLAQVHTSTESLCPCIHNSSLRLQHKEPKHSKTATPTKSCLYIFFRLLLFASKHLQ